MKKIKFLLLAIVALTFSCSDDKDDNNSLVADFENLSLENDSYWNGSDMKGELTKSGNDSLYSASFTSGDVEFTNKFSITHSKWGRGTSWSGFAYSNKTDKETAGYANQYSVYNGSGVNESKNFAVFYGNGMIQFKSKVKIKGMYVTNGTYGYLSMKNGDQFAKKFTDSDWFKVKIHSVSSSNELVKNVEFKLADGTNIVSDWTWVDLSSLGEVDKLTFTFESTDKSQYGINTPSYVLIDNVTYEK
jgi:hypothetical protein